MKQIIYATDCSPNSVNTLRFAVDLSAKLKSQLNLMHIYNMPPIENTTFRTVQHLHSHAQQEHQELLKEYLSSSCPGATTKGNITLIAKEHTSITRAILDSSNRLEADLVIIGRKDEHSNRGLFAGNIANALLSRLACPILVLPNDINVSNFKSIVYASDFEADDVLALEHLCTIAQAYGSEMKVVHIPTKSEYSSEEQMEWFKEMVDQKLNYDNIHFHLIISNNILEGLHAFVKNSDANLLAMLEREDKGFWGKTLYGDKVIKMKSASNIPMLCYNRQCFDKA